MYATCPRVLVPVKGTTQCGTTTVKENSVGNLFMVVVLAIIINLKLVKNVNNFVSFGMTVVNF